MWQKIRKSRVVPPLTFDLANRWQFGRGVWSDVLNLFNIIKYLWSSTLNPSLSFKWMNIPRGSRTACFSGYSGDSIRLFTAFWDVRTHAHTGSRADTRSPHRLLPWIYQSRDCKLWSIINSDEWDGGDAEKWRWNKVLPSLPFLILIGSRDTIFHPLWHNSYPSVVLVHVRWHTSLKCGARRNYEELRRCSSACFEIQYSGGPPSLIISPIHTFYIIQSGV